MATVMRKKFSDLSEEIVVISVTDVARFIKKRRKEGITKRPVKPIGPWLIDMALSELDSNVDNLEKIVIIERGKSCKG